MEVTPPSEGYAARFGPHVLAFAVPPRGAWVSTFRVARSGILRSAPGPLRREPRGPPAPPATTGNRTERSHDRSTAPEDR